MIGAHTSKIIIQAAFELFIDHPDEDSISAENLGRLFAMLGHEPSEMELKELLKLSTSLTLRLNVKRTLLLIPQVYDRTKLS